MFQSFEALTDPAQGADRVARLRAHLAGLGLDGFLVPRADEHQGEYVPPRAERLAWLTGFTGSAGVALVLRESALLFVDGRYTLQAPAQVDTEIFTVESLVDNPPAKWLAAHAGAGLALGFDPWLHTVAEAEALRAALEKAGGGLVPVETNAVDAIWADQPAPPSERIEIHPAGFAGELARDKIARLAATLRDEGATHAVLTDPSSLAWVFNIRGRDVPHTPLALGFAILAADGLPLVFLARAKLDMESDAYLTQLAEVLEPEALEERLAAIAAGGGKIALDPALAADRLRMIVEDHGGEVVRLADPARLPRAIKNEAELAGARAAHRRDGAAIVRFLHWLDTQAAGSVDEIAAVTALEGFRRSVGEETQMKLRDIAFDTISGAGPNGAIVHYRVTEETNRQLEAGELYLVDSGGQYPDGTTDITRTLPAGVPSDDARTAYTRVLQGMIAISRARFPRGVAGAHLDALARYPLWLVGADYDHGTGHGVGAALSVHEGPVRISRVSTLPLAEGMILSNEPGYYRAGAFGIRIENLLAIRAAPDLGEGRAMLEFETLTLVPIDTRLLDRAALTEAERDWLNAYHARVAEALGPHVSPATRDWLARACAPI